MNIENIKQAIKSLAPFLARLHNRLKDGKFSFVEILQTVGDLVTLAALAKAYKEVIAECKDLDIEEFKALVRFVLDEMGVHNAEEKETVERLLAVLR